MKRLAPIFRLFDQQSKLTLINILGMALGFVVSGIIIAYVYQEFNYDKKNLKSDRVYRVIQKSGEQQGPYTYAPLANALQSDLPEVEQAVRVSFFSGYLACAAANNQFNECHSIFADPEFFNLFSFELVKGDPDDCLTSPNSVVLSETAAKKYFGNEDPMGKPLRIGEESGFTVTGVFQDFKANSNFQGDLVLPLEKISKLTQIWIEPSWNHESDIHTFVLLSEKADAEAFSMKGRNLISKYVEGGDYELSFQRLKDIHIEIQFFWESVPQANVKYLYVLITVAGIILCISCVNFLFLYIGTADKRTVGTGIKKICGASKMVLFLEHFREVLVLMFVSGIFAVVFYGFYHSWIADQFSFLPRIVVFDHKLLVILLAVTIGIAILAGIYPSIILSSRRPVTLFSKQKREIGKVKFVNLLVMGQFALCIALIAITLLMYKQVNYMEKQDPGYAMEELITIPLNMHVGHGIYNDQFGVFAEELKKSPGVKNVTVSYSGPASVNSDEEGSDANWEGKPKGKTVKMQWNSVSYDYFETLGLKIVKGRSFSQDFPSDEVNWDTREGAFMLNESAVKAMELEDPIGKQFEVWGFKGPIIGIVEDYNFRSLHSEIKPLFFQVNPFFLNEIIVRLDPSFPSVLTDIETVWNKFVSDYPLEFNYVTDQVETLYQEEDNLASTLNVVSLMAILIACMGLFTLTILSISQRTKEIGIRKVNGAKVAEILSMLNKDFVKWVFIAFIIAVPVSWYAMNKWLENFAYKTELNWWIFALAGLFALGIALLTVSWQSWRAATRNPVEALRYE